MYLVFTGYLTNKQYDAYSGHTDFLQTACKLKRCFRANAFSNLEKPNAQIQIDVWRHQNDTLQVLTINVLSFYYKEHLDINFVKKEGTNRLQWELFQKHITHYTMR